LKTHSIGTEKESSLHRALKYRYAGSNGQTESPVGAYVADGISESGELIEVQIGSFGPLRKKIKDLASHRKIKIVHPVIITKYIEVFDKKGKRLYRRKSPRRGSKWDLFDALLYAPELALIPNLSIELALVDSLERRIRDGKGSWRRKGISIIDKELAAWHETILLEKPADYRRCFLPFKKNEEFTVPLLAERAGIQAALARKTLYVLYKLELVERIGKMGNLIVYKQ
jgi:stalled ribosome alternative rescue factor ArfA